MNASELVRARVASMQGYVPGEQPRESDLVKLNTNENPYPPSPKVVEAIAREAAGAMQLYPSPDAAGLRAAAASRYGVAPEQVLAGNGSDEILSILLRATIEPGERVALVEPTYSLYRTLCAIAGAEVSAVQCRAGELPDPSFGREARLVFVCTPNAPFGTRVPLATVAAVATASSGVVVADEAYIDFGGESALAILDSHPNLVVTRTFSKSFSLAGLRLGLAMASPGLIAELAKVKDSYNVSRLAAAAGVAALEDYAWMEANVARVCATRDRVRAGLLERGWQVPESVTNFLWCLPPAGASGASVYRRLRERRILVRWFDHPLLTEGVRVSIGTDAQMDRFLAAIDG